jgi:hypothetical protein
MLTKRAGGGLVLFGNFDTAVLIGTFNTFANRQHRTTSRSASFAATHPLLRLGAMQPLRLGGLNSSSLSGNGHDVPEQGRC